jgi:hypothetical protein
MPEEKWKQIFAKPILWKFIHELKFSGLVFSRGVTKRCPLSLLTNSALVIQAQMRGKGGRCGVSANEYTCAHHVTWSPNKLCRSTSIFNVWFSGGQTNAGHCERRETENHLHKGRSTQVQHIYPCSGDSTSTWKTYIPVQEKIQAHEKHISLFRRKYKHLKNVYPCSGGSTSIWQVHIFVQGEVQAPEKHIFLFRRKYKHLEKHISLFRRKYKHLTSTYLCSGGSTSTCLLYIPVQEEYTHLTIIYSY